MIVDRCAHQVSSNLTMCITKCFFTVDSLLDFDGKDA